jgi:lysozyme family protein
MAGSRSGRRKTKTSLREKTMKANFAASLPPLYKWEKKGAYTNNPEDPGGETKSGIDIETARNYGYKGPMKDLPNDLADEIYKKVYWDPFRLDQVDDQEIANQILQAAVNQGVDRWKVYIQNICNEFLLVVEALIVDGMVGPRTVAAINSIITAGKRAELSKSIWQKQQDRYDYLIEKNSALAWAKNGWRNRALDFLISDAA